MTRTEAYAEGWHQGRRWAETDIADGLGVSGQILDLVEEAKAYAENSAMRAWQLGCARGYRDTVFRYEAGELTREMFENAPLGT